MTEAAMQARREYIREWKKKNREHLQEYQRKWRKQNPEKVKQYADTYWAKKAVNLKENEV